MLAVIALLLFFLRLFILQKFLTHDHYLLIFFNSTIISGFSYFFNLFIEFSTYSYELFYYSIIITYFFSSYFYCLGSMYAYKYI